jgi:MFS family permease
LTEDPGTLRIRFGGFVALTAAMMATQAIAIDSMLPAFPAIVAALEVSNPNHGQWIVTAYMAGLGAGQLVWGLLSDRFGRRPIVLGGLGLYIVAAAVCGLTQSFEALLAWRFVHGLAAASATVVRSIVRDLYSGRQMARVLSLTFVVFLTVPVLAPSLGQAILWIGSWRYIFMACGASVSNFGAMAMEPVGAVAGVGASLQGCISTGCAAIVAAVIGREFNGSTLPLAAGSLCCGLLALGFVLVAERGRLFRQHHAGAA